MNNKSNKLGLGIIIGSVIGGLSAYFLSPKSGKENREEFSKKAKKLQNQLKDKEIDEQLSIIFGSITDETRRFYKDSKKGIDEKLKEMKASISDIDTEKYKGLVSEIVDSIGAEFDESKERMDKLKKHFVEKGKQAKEHVKEDIKKVSKKTE